MPPFQQGSRGFAVGEAAVGFVLTHRAADPYLTVLGGAMTHDAHHLTSVDPALTHVVDCVHEALRHAGVAAEQIRCMNAHGPGTHQCDTAEITLLEQMFAARPQIYSVKPLTGHCQGRRRRRRRRGRRHSPGLPPRRHPRTAHRRPGHRRLLDGPTPIPGGITLKTSLGMGGHNSAVILAPPHH